MVVSLYVVHSFFLDHRAVGFLGSSPISELMLYWVHLLKNSIVGFERKKVPVLRCAEVC